MELPLIYYGDPLLRKKCQPVEKITDEVKKLVKDMVDTMEAANGIGLAAPQIGVLLRVFITCVPIEDENTEDEYLPGEIRVYINPEILEVSEEMCELSEGCLSIPTVSSYVVRPYFVKVRATDLEGNVFITESAGLEAHCILHENDHINGVLFIDRIRGKERKALDSKLRKVKEDYYLRHKKNA